MLKSVVGQNRTNHSHIHSRRPLTVISCCCVSASVQTHNGRESGADHFRGFDSNEKGLLFRLGRMYYEWEEEQPHTLTWWHPNNNPVVAKAFADIIARKFVVSVVDNKWSTIPFLRNTPESFMAWPESWRSCPTLLLRVDCGLVVSASNLSLELLMKKFVICPCQLVVNYVGFAICLPSFLSDYFSINDYR